MRAARRRWLLEGAAVAALVPLGVIEILTSADRTGPAAVHVAAVIALGIALLWCRSRPLEAALLGSTAVGVQSLVGWAGAAGELVLFLLLVFATGTASGNRTRTVALTALGAAFLAVLLRDPAIGTFAAALPSLVFFLAAAAAGVGVGHRVASAAALVEAARRAQQAREESAARQLAYERTRLARELHDVVTHSLSVVVVQAGAMRLDAPPEQAERLAALENTARDALGEMRRLLGLLRGEPDSTLGPQPGLAQIPELLDRLRSAGLDASLEVNGTGPALTPGLDLTVYRIVQEATTNVLRHAAARCVIVALDWQEDRLVVRVTDDGKPGAVTGRDGGGRVAAGTQ